MCPQSAYNPRFLVRIADAVTFKAGERVLVEEAVAGDIIGLHNPQFER